MKEIGVNGKWKIWMAATMAFPGIAGADLNFPQVVLDDSYVAYERDVGDVNGDGLNDVVAVGAGGTTVEWFQAPDWTRRTLFALSGTYGYTRADDFKVADVDGDGDADLVVRLGRGPTDDGEGRAAWIENLGSGASWTVRIVGVSPSYGKDIAVGDLDRDGRLDLVYREDSLTQIWFNETNRWTEVRLVHGAHEGMELGDLDMDGDLDVVLNGFWFATPNAPAACRSAGNYAYQSIDSQWYDQTGDWTANSCKVAVGDVDGDGTNDVAFSHSERAGYAVTWYRRANGAWSAHPVAIVDYAHTLQVYDADLDGDRDVLTGGMPQSTHRGLRLFLNAGAGASWTPQIIQSEGSYSAELGDVDNDGDLDIVGVVNWNAAPSYVYRSNAGGPPSLDFWRYVRVSDRHERTFGMAFADVDADGDQDVASGRYLYRNPGGSLTGAWIQTTVDADIHLFQALDVDGDDRADWLAMRPNSAANRIDLYWYEAQDAAGTDWHAVVKFGEVPNSEHPAGFQGSRLAQIAAGDRPEIVISTSQGPCYFTVPANPAAGACPRVWIAANDSDEGVDLADFDGDGRLDLAFTGGASKQVKWARNPGDGSSPWPVFVVGTFAEADWPDRCEAGDFNGDGRPDVAVTEENAGSLPDALAYWWEQPAASPTNGNWTRHWVTTRYTLNSMDGGDVDRDGDLDLVLAEHRGDKRISVFGNDGSGAFSEHLVGSGEENHLGARLIDLDGDGDLDLAGIAYDDYARLHVWRNDSPRGGAPVVRPILSPASTNLAAAGANGVSLAVSATVDWTAAATAPWLSISGGSSGSGNGTVVYDVAANAGAYRYGAIVVAGGGVVRTCVVTQLPGVALPEVAADFDGDGAADAATYRPANGNWGFAYSGGGSATTAFGWSATVPVPADYDGDGTVDLAAYHPAGGKWYVRQSSAGDRIESFGWNATIPLPGDYDGDGRADLAVFYRPTARWYFRYSQSGTDYNLAYGWSAVIPVPADYDGNGAVEIAAYHPASGNWYLSSGGVVHLGGGKALPVPADYDGDGKADCATFTRANGTWQIAYSGGGGLAQGFGWSATLPVPADYDGDGKADLAVYHPAGGKWYVLSSQTGATLVKSLGGTDRQPVLLNSLIYSWFKMN